MNRAYTDGRSTRSVSGKIDRKPRHAVLTHPRTSERDDT